MHPQSFCSLRNPRTDSACSFVVRLSILRASCTSTPERNLWQGGLGLLPANQHSELTASSGIKVQPIFRSVRTEILHCFAKRILACQVSMRGICEKWLQNLFRKYEGRDRLGDLGVDFRIILKWCGYAARSTIRVSNSRRAKWFFCSPKRPDRLWVPPTLLLCRYWSSFLAVKRPVRELNHSDSSSAKVRWWSCIFSPPILDDTLPAHEGIFSEVSSIISQFTYSQPYTPSSAIHRNPAS